MNGWRKVLVTCAAGLTIGSLLAGCGRGESAGKAARSPGETSQLHTFQVKGVVIAVKARKKEIEIKHEAIPDYMPAMTMPFEVRDTNELKGIEPGQSIRFRLNAGRMEAWIDQIRIAGSSVSQGPAAGASVRVVRDVEPLGVGDPLPDYVLTNQFGEAFHLTQYKGQALAITFLFTRCPFPTFCPRMADHFREAQQQLTAMTDVAGNWHLLTVSFDPEFDRPAVLKAYAEGRQYKPARWTFATGSLVDVTALGDQLGLAFWRDEPGSLSHNLRTAVFDAGGRLQKVFAGNEWTVEELVNELRLAASRK